MSNPSDPSEDKELEAGTADTLIETGLGLVRTLEDDRADFDTAAAAASQLRELVTRLDVAEPNARTDRAVKRFEAVLARHEQQNRLHMFIGMGTVLLLGAGCVWGIVWWLGRSS